MICAATGPALCLPFGAAGSAIHDLDFSHSLARFLNRSVGTPYRNKAICSAVLIGITAL